MRETKWVSAVVMTVGIVASIIFYPMYGAEATTKLIDTSTGERRPLMNTVEPLDFRKVPAIISGDNIYIAWSTNNTGNDEVMFRSSTDGGATFADKINLSNSNDTESQDVEIDADDGNIVVTWWERNATSDEPVVRISSDNGQTFGAVLMLSTNGTITSGAD